MFLSFEEISHVLVYGDGKPFLIALIKINDEYRDANIKKIDSEYKL